MCSIDPLLSHYGITVDRTKEEKIEFFFLSHAHEDHVKGLNPTFFKKRPTTLVYTTLLTKELLLLYKPKLQPFAQRILTIRWDLPVTILSDRVKVIALPAYHCDGSSMFLFDFIPEQKRILYTGDFRFHPVMRNWRYGPVDTIYYDDTFTHMAGSIPTQEESDRVMKKVIEKEQHVYINMSVLGFEPALRRLLREKPQWRLYMDPKLKETWRGQQIELLLSQENWTQCQAEANLWLTHRKLKKHWKPNVPVIVPTATKFLCEKWQKGKEQCVEVEEVHGKTLYIFIFYVTHSNGEEIKRFFCHVPHKKIKSCDYDGIKSLKCLIKE